MLIPSTIKLAGFRGASFSQQVNFWKDSANTQPFDFSTWTVALIVTPIGPQPAFSPSVNVSGGALIFSATPAQTAAAGSLYHVVIKLTATSGSPAEIEYIAHGTLTFSDP